jgi:hypothetical protein
MIFVMQAGNNRHDHICEAMELFAAEIMPEFKERRPEVEARKQERLAPAVKRITDLARVDERPEVDFVIQAEPY